MMFSPLDFLFPVSGIERPRVAKRRSAAGGEASLKQGGGGGGGGGGGSDSDETPSEVKRRKQMASPTKRQRDKSRNAADDSDAKRPRLACSYCSSTFVSFEDLFMHRQLDHRLSRRNQDVIDMSTDSCELCEASFDNANAKIRHFALFHEKVLDLYCISCKKIFKGLNTPWQLKRHEQRHHESNWIETEHEPFKDR